MRVESYKNNATAMKFFTGFRSFEHFNYFYGCCLPAIERLDYNCEILTPINELFLCLMKLRVDKCNEELGILFGISSVTAGRVFNTQLRFLYFHLSEISFWLPKDIVQQFMPSGFKEQYPLTRVILDGTEFRIDKPSKVKDQAATWSSYKNKNTLKVIVGVTPKGVVSHVSEAYGGAASDRQILERSELLNEDMFEGKDQIMSDRGIRVQDLFASKNVLVNTPTMLKGKSQLSAAEVIRDRRVASKRVHVERVIGLAKTFKILKNDMNHSKTAVGEMIIRVCFLLCNFKPCIINNDA